MTKLLASLGIATMAVSIAGAALALNPQPLAPRCVQGVHCGGGHGGSRPSVFAHQRHCIIRHHHRICRGGH